MIDVVYPTETTEKMAAAGRSRWIIPANVCGFSYRFCGVVHYRNSGFLRSGIRSRYGKVGCWWWVEGGWWLMCSYGVVVSGSNCVCLFCLTPVGPWWCFISIWCYSMYSFPNWFSVRVLYNVFLILLRVHMCILHILICRDITSMQGVLNFLQGDTRDLWGW